MAEQAPDGEGKPPRRWLGAAAWPLVVLLAWVLFELTAKPALAVIALCLKFGWNDIQTACWLRRRDPCRGRGWACLFLYLACGLWKTALAGCLLTIGLVIFMGVAQGAKKQALPNVVHEQGIAAWLTAVGISVLASLSTGVAIQAARVSRVKLWLHGCTHRARRQDIWPPPDEGRGVHNQAHFLTRAVFFITILPTLVLTFRLNMALVQQGGAASLGEILGYAFGLAACLACLYALARRQGYCEGAVFAQSPAECWRRFSSDGVTHPSAEPQDSSMVL
jgi:hypothetical protein